jgi:hypothetical protein
MLYNEQTTMKNLLITLVAALALITTGFAQSTTTSSSKQSGGVSAQSQTIEVTSTSLNLLYLRDGYDNYAAFTLPLYTFANTNGRLKLNTFGAFDPANIERRAYVGTGLSFDVLDEKGWKLTAFGGLKGFNLADNFRFQDGKRGFVYGFGLSIPFSTK